MEIQILVQRGVFSALIFVYTLILLLNVLFYNNLKLFYKTINAELSVKRYVRMEGPL